MQNEPVRVYRLRDGDVFTIAIDALTPDVLNNPNVKVLKIRKIRSWWRIKLLGCYRNIPKLSRRYLFTFQYHENT